MRAVRTLVLPRLAPSRGLSTLPPIDASRLTAADAEQFNADGATVLRGLLPRAWLDALRAAAEENLRHPGPLCDEHAAAAGTGGRFHDDQFLWTRHDACREFVLRSGAGAVAAKACARSHTPASPPPAPPLPSAPRAPALPRAPAPRIPNPALRSCAVTAAATAIWVERARARSHPGTRCFGSAGGAAAGAARACARARAAQAMRSRTAHILYDQLARHRRADAVAQRHELLARARRAGAPPAAVVVAPAAVVAPAVVAAAASATATAATAAATRRRSSRARLVRVARGVKSSRARAGRRETRASRASLSRHARCCCCWWRRRWWWWWSDRLAVGSWEWLGGTPAAARAPPSPRAHRRARADATRA